jgi:nitroreductase
VTESRTATTSAPLHPLLADRWSPRAFDPVAQLTVQQVTALLEAARWAPSAANSQPWRFLLAPRGSADFERIFATLAAGNQPWAGSASALVLVAAATVDDNGAAAPWALYDTGQAVAHLSTQASHEGLSVHQLGGFDAAAATEAFALDATVTPIVVLAIGVLGDATGLPEPYAARETAPRTRRPLEHILLTNTAYDDADEDSVARSA